MNDTVEKPTNEEIEKVRSRLLFLKSTSNLLIVPSVLVYIFAYIALLVLDQIQYIPSIIALALLSSMIFIDKFYSFKEEYKIIEKENKGVQDV